jgi:hypothetical protein
MEAEARSLFSFARNAGLSFSESLGTLIRKDLPVREGSEHKAFLVTAGKNRRVVKVTHAGKYGRNENTPYQYLLRWKLLNELAPSADARIEDCIQNPKKEISIITSMNYFLGPHPTPVEADEFVRSLGFELLRDGSSTLDYFNSEAKLILRDSHPGNWVKTENTLIPIDIIFERVD